MDDEEVERVDQDSYYAVLNVPRDASEDEIKRSYRHLAQACHPDKVLDPAAREQASVSFMRIQEAYEVTVDTPEVDAHHLRQRMLQPPMPQNL